MKTAIAPIFSGKGICRVSWIFERSLPGIFQVIGGVALSVTLFTAPVPSGGWLTALNNPLMAVVLFVVLVGDVLLASLCYDFGNQYWFKFDDIGRFGNRVFSFFGHLFNDAKRAADLRIYRQFERVAIPFWRANNIFAVTSPAARIVHGPMGLWLAASSAVTALLTGIAYVFVCLKAGGGAFGIDSVTQYIGAITTMFLGFAVILKQSGEMHLNGPFLQRLFDFLDTPNTMYRGIFAVVFQDFRLFALPLGQNVAAGAHYDRERVMDCLSKADFGDRLKTLPDGLDTPLYKELDKNGVEVSGGEAQKIAIARALYKDAPFIILDEPTSFLDIRHKLELLAILRRMAKEKGITVIMSLHEIDLAQKIADKIICVKGDTISHFGKPEDIFEEVEKRLSITKVVSLLNENPEYVDIAEKAKEIQKRVIEMEKRKKYLKEKKVILYFNYKRTK